MTKPEEATVKKPSEKGTKSLQNSQDMKSSSAQTDQPKDAQSKTNNGASNNSIKYREDGDDWADVISKEIN